MSSSRIAWQKDEWEKCHSSQYNPFDLEEPYEWVVTLEREGRIRGNVLDLGCGAGHNGIYLASKGYGVTGVDISLKAIERAKQKAFARRIAIKFFQADIRQPLGYMPRFDTVLDIGCFHSLPEEDHVRYVVTLHRSCRPGARIFMRAFSDFNETQQIVVHGKVFSPPSVTEDQLRRAFSQGWTVARLDHKEIELGELGAIGRSRQRQNVWFAELERN